MRYNAYSFLWPPRPGSDQAIPPDMLGRWERQGYWAEIKKNGTGNTIARAPDGQLTIRRRDKTLHKQWTADPAKLRAFSNMPGTGWHYVCTELMHNKVRGLRDIHYIHDILVYNSEYLIGTTFAERQELLRKLFPTTTRSIDGHYWVVDEYTWLTHNYTSGFQKLFCGLSRDDDEGLVLKDPNAKLALCLRENSNSRWQLKCRRPTPNYGF